MRGIASQESPESNWAILFSQRPGKARVGEIGSVLPLSTNPRSEAPRAHCLQWAGETESDCNRTRIASSCQLHWNSMEFSSLPCIALHGAGDGADGTPGLGVPAGLRLGRGREPKDRIFWFSLQHNRLVLDPSAALGTDAAA